MSLSVWYVMDKYKKRIFWLLGIITVAGVLVLFYFAPDLWSWDQQRLVASATVAATLFTALAAFGALNASRESSRAARDAVRAIGLATKPEVSLYMNPGTEFGSSDAQQEFTLGVENLSMNHIARCRVEWRLRDGSEGFRELGHLPARTLPKKDFEGRGPARENHLGSHDASLPGVDWARVTYWGQVPEVGFQHAIEWDHQWRQAAGGNLFLPNKTVLYDRELT